MPHALDDYRDELDALIGPIEQILYDLSVLSDKIDGIVIPGEGGDGYVDHRWDRRVLWITAGIRGDLEEAKEGLETIVSEIDSYEPPEEPPEPEDDPDEPEDDDEDEEEDEDA